VWARLSVWHEQRYAEWKYTKHIPIIRMRNSISYSLSLALLTSWLSFLITSVSFPSVLPQHFNIHVSFFLISFSGTLSISSCFAILPPSLPSIFMFPSSLLLPFFLSFYLSLFILLLSHSFLLLIPLFLISRVTEIIIQQNNSRFRKSASLLFLLFNNKTGVQNMSQPYFMSHYFLRHRNDTVRSQPTEMKANKKRLRPCFFFSKKLQVIHCCALEGVLLCN
jgi:hypothetical protein